MNNIEIALRLNLASFTAQASAAGASVRKLGTDIKGSFREAGSEASKFGKNAVEATSRPKVTIDQLGKGALIMGAGMLAGFGLAVRATMEFDRQLSELQAVSGATGDEMEQLRSQALQMGQDTAFSASEAAQAQTELAKAGVSTADIMGGALAGSLALAGAGSLDLATSAEIAANAMQVFGLNGEDVGHVADVLANAANRSSADVEGMAMSLKQTGLVADQLGLSLEDTVGTLSAFAQAGLQGSDAGTSLKTALQRFVPQSKEAADEMERLGINFFDARGQFVGITGAAEILQNRMSGLTQEQRASAMQTIFGADAIRAATILYQQGGDGLQGWIDAVGESGTAALMAQAKMDNLAGDLEQLRGSIETALIGSGSKATGVLRSMAQAATDAVNAFIDLPEWAQTGAIAFLGLGGAALTVVGALGTLYPRLRSGVDAMRDMGTMGAAAADNLGRFARATTGVVILTTAVGALADAIDPLDEADLSALENDLLDLAESGRVAGEAASVMGGDFGALGDSFERVVDPSNLSRLSTFTNEVTTLGGLLGRGVADDLDVARKKIDDLDKALANLAGQDPAAAADAFRQISAALREQGFSTEQITGQFDDYGAALNELDTANRTAGGSADGLSGDMSEVAGSYEEAESALRSYIDAQKAQFDPLFAALDAQNGIRDAHVAYEDSLIGVEEAQRGVNAAIEEFGRASPEAAAAQRDLESAERGVEDALVGQTRAAYDADQAWIELADAIAENPALMESARSTMQQWVDEGMIPSAAAADYVNERLGALGMTAVDTASRRVEIPVSERGAPRTRAELHGVRDAAEMAARQRPTVTVNQVGAAMTFGWLQNVTGAAQGAGRERPTVSVNEVGSALTFGWLQNVTGAAQETGRQRPNVAVSESGSGRSRAELWGVRDAANSIPGSRSTTVSANDQASGTIGGILGRLNSLYDRTVTITTIQRTIIEGARSVFPALRRWGGVDNVTHAQDGLMQAGVYRSPVIYFAEPETGGEAFIPRRGDPRRSEQIIDTAAAWYGLAVVPREMVRAQAGHINASPPSVLEGVGRRQLQAAGAGPVLNMRVAVDVRPTVGVDGMALADAVSTAVRREVDEAAGALAMVLRKA